MTFITYHPVGKITKKKQSEGVRLKIHSYRLHFRKFRLGKHKLSETVKNYQKVLIKASPRVHEFNLIFFICEICCNST